MKSPIKGTCASAPKNADKSAACELLEIHDADIYAGNSPREAASFLLITSSTAPPAPESTAKNNAYFVAAGVAGFISIPPIIPPNGDDRLI